MLDATFTEEVVAQAALWPSTKGDLKRLVENLERFRMGRREATRQTRMCPRAMMTSPRWIRVKPDQRRSAAVRAAALPTFARERTAANMGRQMRSDDVHELLMRNLNHPRWDQVAERCLTCGNCTMVCPTCFCTSVEESSDLAGAEMSRSRRWDSCFTMDFSYVHGGSVRSSSRSRYRQWMTHKLATWWNQFGSSGCVGCGRCITWCPVGIDITEEVQAIRESGPQSGA